MQNYDKFNMSYVKIMLKSCWIHVENMLISHRNSNDGAIDSPKTEIIPSPASIMQFQLQLICNSLIISWFEKSPISRKIGKSGLRCPDNSGNRNPELEDPSPTVCCQSCCRIHECFWMLKTLLAELLQHTWMLLDAGQAAAKDACTKQACMHASQDA